MRFFSLILTGSLLLPMMGKAEIAAKALALNPGEPQLPVGLEETPPMLQTGGVGRAPALPAGLNHNAPELPAGLNNTPPKLPAGSNDNNNTEIQSKPIPKEKDPLPFDLTGFIETRLGTRLQSDPTQKQTSIGEARLHWETQKIWESTTGTLVTDLIYDPILNRHAIDLETGEGWLDLRELNLLFRPTQHTDLKIGRQILTWGTGDLLFINDLFPKDWNSFFIGRDEEYLKSPSDALKIAFYHKVADLDFVYTPRFDPDRFINGRRISYFNGNTGTIAGRNQVIITKDRQHWFSEDEIALRAHRLIGAYETAAYFYHGYWKSPAEVLLGTPVFAFPKLSVYGASLRGPIKGGILNVEFGYYASRDDNDGKNPLIANSEWRFLVGYERELWSEMTAVIQYYQEWLQNYGAYLNHLPAGAVTRDEHRHLFTLRLTQLLMSQNLMLSLFTFYSPSDQDAYLRPNVTYKLDDHYTISLGGNVFFGRKRNTFFGQFKDNSNIYASIRYGF